MSRARNWCFTLNNPSWKGSEGKALELLDEYKASYIIFQKETGKEGTPHFQGYIQVKEKVRLSHFKV